MARMTARKDSLTSFILTVGAADMVIGGVGDRGSLFALGLLTAGTGLLVSWLRQRRYRQRPLGTILLRRGQRNRGAMPFQAGPPPPEAPWQPASPRGRAAQRYLQAGRLPGAVGSGFEAAGPVGPVPGPAANPRAPFPRQSSPSPGRVIQAPAQRLSQDDSPGLSSPGLSPPGQFPVSPRESASMQPPQPPPGPPLNLPPAPRHRARRGRRIY